jgi:hypothetical protein
MPHWSPVQIAAAVAAAVVVVVVLVLVLVNRSPTMQTTRADDGAARAPAPQLMVIKKHDCPACKTLVPIVKTLQAAGTRVQLVEGPAMGMQWHRDNNVRAYPTICMASGNPADGSLRVTRVYNGPRTGAGIRTFAKVVQSVGAV